MKEKRKALVCLLPVGLLFVGLCLAAWLHTPQEMSLSERRALAQRPVLSADSLLSGGFMSQFDKYSMDQFPLREGFRTLKAITQYYLMGQGEINGIFLSSGSLIKREEGLKADSVRQVGQKMEGLFETHFSSGRAFFAWVPDKGYFAPRPGMDYEALQAAAADAFSFAQQVDLAGLLSLEDYYATDSHWRQERLEPVARALAAAMGAELSGELTPALARADFSGVYAGQSALPVAAEAMYYMDSPVLQAARVRNEAGEESPVYDLEALWGRDPYDLYLSGAAPLQVIDNPSGPEGRELVIFRDSYGSSLAPWLVSGYRRVTLVDLRYLSSSLLGEFVEDRGQDVLFLFSTGILQSSALLK